MNISYFLRHASIRREKSNSYLTTELKQKEKQEKLFNQTLLQT